MSEDAGSSGRAVLHARCDQTGPHSHSKTNGGVMKKIIVAAILAVVATTPALAQYRYLSRTAVVYDGKIIGQDPDPNVRLDLRKNSDFYAGYQP
jgi:hypothetical protein